MGLWIRTALANNKTKWIKIIVKLKNKSGQIGSEPKQMVSDFGTSTSLLLALIIYTSFITSHHCTSVQYADE